MNTFYIESVFKQISQPKQVTKIFGKFVIHGSFYLFSFHPDINQYLTDFFKILPILTNF